MSVVCPKCLSENVRSYDNESLSHPSKEDVKNGEMRYDNEVYVKFECDDCEETFTKTFSLVERK